MEEQIKTYIEKNNLTYIKLDTNDLQTVFNFYFVKNDFIDDVSAIVLLYYGMYYYIENDYTNMKTFYLKSIEKGNITAMNMLAEYYEKQGDMINAIKYYLMAENITKLESMHIDTIVDTLIELDQKKSDLDKNYETLKTDATRLEERIKLLEAQMQGTENS